MDSSLPIPSDHGILILDCRGIIAFASVFLCDLLGFEPGILRGRSYLDLVAREDLPTASKGYELGEAKSLSFTLVRKDGFPILVDVERAALRHPTGRIYGIQATIMRSTVVGYGSRRAQIAE